MSKTKTKKRSKIGDIIYYTIMIILLGVMAFSGFKVYRIASEYKKGSSVYDSIAEEVGAIPESTGPEQIHLETRLTIDWEKLRETNADTVAWIRAGGTPINYPVVQGKDKVYDYYLNYLFDGTWNVKGSIFMDVQCDNPFNDFLTIIYGHLMNDGTMFTKLHDYINKKDGSFFREHPIMEIYTPEKNYDLYIFGAAIINSSDMFLYNPKINDKDEEQRYIDWIFANSQLAGFDNSVSVTTDDHIVMLSTCLGGPQNVNRVVAWGKLVEVEKSTDGN